MVSNVADAIRVGIINPIASFHHLHHLLQLKDHQTLLMVHQVRFTVLKVILQQPPQSQNAIIQQPPHSRTQPP